jgi:tetratricopeptide (TPR) repeat protein
MNGIQDLHRRAMEAADEADRFRRLGDLAGAKRGLSQAFDLERQAAGLTAADESLEPTRSVLHRSAASLALECGDYREAERLIAVALSGDPPDELAEELRDLLEQVYFDRPASGRRRPLKRTNSRPGG